MGWHNDLCWLKRSMQGVLRQGFEFVELQRREDNFLHRSLVLKFGNDLPCLRPIKLTFCFATIYRSASP